MDATAAKAAGSIRQSRRGRGLEIATWVMLGLNVLGLAALLAPGAAAVDLQEQIEQMNDDTRQASNALSVYFVGIAVCTVLGNGLAIWKRRSSGIVWAIGATLGCWIVFGTALRQAQG